MPLAQAIMITAATLGDWFEPPPVALSGAKITAISSSVTVKWPFRSSTIQASCCFGATHPVCGLPSATASGRRLPSHHRTTVAFGRVVHTDSP